LSKIVKSSQIKFMEDRYLLPILNLGAELPSSSEDEERVDDPVENEEENGEEIEIKDIEEPADEEQPEIHPTPEEIRENAKKKAAEIKRKAEEEAEKILEKASKEAEVLQTQVKKEAERKGRTRGEKEAYQEGIKAWEDLLKKSDKQFEELFQDLKDWKEELPAQVIDLSIGIARRILSAELESNPEIIIPRIQDAVAELSSVGEVIIKVSRDDFPLLEGAREQLKQENGGLGNIRLSISEEINPGDFLLETEYGCVDGRISTQLDLISQELKERWKDNDQA